MTPARAEVGKSISIAAANRLYDVRRQDGIA